MVEPPLNSKFFDVDVEQAIHAFLEQQGRRKSQRKIKGGASRGHRGNSVGIA